MPQEPVRRLSGLGATAPTVVCNEAHRFLAAEQAAPDHTGSSGVPLLAHPNPCSKVLVSWR
jgi:hypothetical protein